MNIALQSNTHTAAARLFVLPLTHALPPVAHLVAPEHANIGDFIGVFGGVSHHPDPGVAREMTIEVAYRKGVLEPENHFIDEMSATDSAKFKEITAVPFFGFNHHLIVRQANMIEEGQPSHVHLVQFADAVLYVHPDWLQGIWGLEDSHKSSRPLMMMLKGAQSREDAAHRFVKTTRYLELFRSALPRHVRSKLNLHLALPVLDDFYASGAADHAFVG